MRQQARKNKGWRRRSQWGFWLFTIHGWRFDEAPSATSHILDTVSTDSRLMGKEL
ncbi:hypothetical protein SynPROS91_01415 [Synechococcus sp. PROS-9-1]|nr:hypothetical protein SynPROS91_01415 [Synechococcus sp. PROS-9-1]